MYALAPITGYIPKVGNTGVCSLAAISSLKSCRSLVTSLCISQHNRRLYRRLEFETCLLFTSQTIPQLHVLAWLLYTVPQTEQTFDYITGEDGESDAFTDFLRKFKHRLSQRNGRVAFRFAIWSCRYGRLGHIGCKVPATQWFRAIRF
jgi:hypothetical protein